MPRPGSDADVPDCLDCGACCFGDLPNYVRVSGDDHWRLGDDAERLTVWHDNRVYMRMEGGHCAALALDGAPGPFACTIYERRPSVCRDLDRGSGACLAERERKAERALVALRRR